MKRYARFALSASALCLGLSLGVSAFASPDAADAASQTSNGHRHGHHPHESYVHRALALTSLSAAQRSQIEALAQEQHGQFATVKASRARVLTALASQVERGTIDRSALAPAVKDETDAMVANRLRTRSIDERLHTVLTAAQCSEVGGGKDFLGPAKDPTEVRTNVERFASRGIDRLEKKLPSMTAEQKTSLASRLRARASR
jgi:Spy/CpxP family protein refolding chaperone